MITLVTVSCIIGAAISLLLAIIFAFIEYSASKQLRDVAEAAGKRAEDALNQRPSQQPPTAGQPPTTPVVAQAAGVDFVGIAKLAEALEKLNSSGRFLIASLALAATAAIAASAGSIATAAG